MGKHYVIYILKNDEKITEKNAKFMGGILVKREKNFSLFLAREELDRPLDRVL